MLTRDIDPAVLVDALRLSRLRRTRRGAYHQVERSAGLAIDRQPAARRRIAALAVQLTNPCGSATNRRR